jgi:hypothetical protein
MTTLQKMMLLTLGLTNLIGRKRPLVLFPVIRGLRAHPYHQEKDVDDPADVRFLTHSFGLLGKAGRSSIILPAFP